MTEYKFKIIGDGAVGKTTFINRLASGEFINNGSDDKTITWEKNVSIHVKTSLNTDADGVVLMFDIHRPESFKYLEKYLATDVPLVLVGNKCDVEFKEDNVKNDLDENDNDYSDNAENRWYVKKWRELQQTSTKMKFYEISAKSGYNLDKPFNALINF